MHPILGSLRRLAIYLLAWLLIGLLLSVGLGLSGGGDWLTAVVFFVPLSLVFALITQSAWYVCRIFPLVRARGWTVAAAQILAAVFASAVWVAAAGGWARTLDVAGVGAAGAALYTTQRPLLFVVGALLFWLVSVFFYLLIAFDASKEAERAERRAEPAGARGRAQGAARADRSAFHLQQPALDQRPDRDRRGGGATHVPAAGRLPPRNAAPRRQRPDPAGRGARAGRSVPRHRAGSARRTGCASPARPTPARRRCLVPPLLLQPLVENAVNHGIAQLVDGGTIRMAATRTGSTLTITLENPCDPDRARTRGVGLGLELLRKRLTNQYGATDAVYAQERAGEFRVEVRIPAVTESRHDGARRPT